jgi:hypothetical protein
VDRTTAAGARSDDDREVPEQLQVHEDEGEDREREWQQREDRDALGKTGCSCEDAHASTPNR